MFWPLHPFSFSLCCFSKSDKITFQNAGLTNSWRLFSQTVYRLLMILPTARHRVDIFNGRRARHSHSCNITVTLCSASLPWSQVMTNTEPPALRSNVAVDRLTEKTALHKDWPLHYTLHNIFFRPTIVCHHADIASQYQDDWKSASVVNSSLVADPTIREPGFDLPH